MTDTTHKLCAKVTIITLCICAIAFVQGVDYPFGSVYRPFSADSPWNCRPVNPILDNTKTVPIAQLFPEIGEGIYSTGVFIASQDDYNMTVYGPSQSRGVAITDILGYATSITIPRWPTNMPISSDNYCEIYDPFDNKIHSFYQLKNVNGIWRATMYAWSALDGVGWGNPGYFSQGLRATGVPTSAGLIRSFEVDDGDSMFRHALTISLTYSGLSKNPSYVFPATSADANAANFGTIPEGSLLMLPFSFNATSLTIPKLIKIAETLKTYGAYVTDRSTTNAPFSIYVEIGSNYAFHPPGGWNPIVASELQIIRAALRPVQSSLGYLNGEGQLINFNLNQNLLSMRGQWLKEYGDSLGYYDTWKQAIVFSNRTVETSLKNINGNGFSKISWATPIAGQLYNITAITTGGGKFRLLITLSCKNLANIDSGNLTNGQSFVFTWPSTFCWTTIYAVSGVNQESSVSVQMLKAEIPVIAPNATTST